MTPGDIQKKLYRLKKEAEGKDPHKFRPTMVQLGFKDDGALAWLEIRSDLDVLFKWPEGHKPLVRREIKTVYQAWQKRPTRDGRGVEGWRFGRESL